MPILLEIVDVLKTISARIEREHGAARILTNLGRYQDSKHLHFHVNSGDPLR
jgi:histidine triad (HIT) family protein